MPKSLETPSREDREIGQRLKAARLVKYPTATAAAKAMGIEPSTYLGHENGWRGLKQNLAKYADEFEVSIDHLLTGVETGGIRLKSPLVGYIGAGAEFFPVDDHMKGNGLEMIDSPPGVDSPTVCAKVRGNSMYPTLEEGWIVFWTKTEDGVPENCIGRVCVVKLLDGRFFVKRVRRGPTSTTFILESHNAPPMEPVELEWASRVRHIQLT